VKYIYGRKSTIGPEAPSALGFSWLMKTIADPQALAEKAEFRHMGKCARCQHRLTTPESIDSGFGPVCAAALGVNWARSNGARSLDPEQFILGGKAIFTVTSKKTGKSFTYKVKQGNGPDAPYFVSVLTGPDNWENYRYLGIIWRDK